MTQPASATGSKMVTRHIGVRFLTPAFLGNADQSGQWRTPPFKHLLREWWRVAWAAQDNPKDWRLMREIEGCLFGHAWLENDRDSHGNKVSGRKSEVLLRLASWSRGACKSIPELKKVADEGKAVSSELYLGYGPVAHAGKLKKEVAVGEGEKTILSLASPGGDDVDKHILSALTLIDRFGTVGGRSRNGWGSIHLELEEGHLQKIDYAAIGRDWRECLELEWAHAIGRDDKGLLYWQSGELANWAMAMELLGRIRKQVNALDVDRFSLNQPVGKKGKRVPSNLRFKIIPAGKGKIRATIFHMPCTPPPVKKSSRQEQTWEAVHAFLDGLDLLQRVTT